MSLLQLTQFVLVYQRCVDAIKSSGYSSLAANLEINKAMVFLHNREVRMAIDSLKVFENQDTKINSSASTVLSFIHFLVSIVIERIFFRTSVADLIIVSFSHTQRGEYDQAEKYGEAAKSADGYNAAAYVNLAACSIMKNELDTAKEYLTNALEKDPNHVQALYNLGPLDFFSFLLAYLYIHKL